MEDVWAVPVGVRPPIDRAEVRHSLGLIVGPGAAHEVRGLPSGRSRTVRGSDPDAAVAAVESLSDDRGVYVTLNPVRPDLAGAARVADVLARRHMLVDCDRVGGTDRNATEAEKAAAWGVCTAVLVDLTRRGWPEPLVIDSGNGYHLLYRVNLPNDKLAQLLLARCLKALQAAHGTAEAAVDVKVHNASRITKLPGTWARKGPPEADRPHRLARVVSEPPAMLPVPEGLLRDLAGLTAATPPGPGPDPGPDSAPAPDAWSVKVQAPAGAAAGGKPGYLEAATADECRKVAAAAEGRRNDALNTAAFRLGQLLHLNGVGRADVERSPGDAARASGLGEAEARATIRSGLDAGMENPREPEERNGAGTAPGNGVKLFVPNAAAGKTVGHSGREYSFPLIVRGSDVRPKKVEWLWLDRIPFGFLTLFAGRTAVGKSFATLDLMARLSVGGEIPLAGGECFPTESALIISEDSQEYMLAPRLIEAGADMGRVNFMSFEAMASFTLDDAQMLDDTYHMAGSPRLVVIDPPTNFLGERDEHRNAEVRSVLMGVSIWTMAHTVACVMITHCNKGVKKDMAALDRIIGSVAWASTSRIAHIFAPHPEEKGQSVFLPMKNNIGKMTDGLSFRVEPTDTLARVEWIKHVELDVDDTMSGKKKKPRGVVAVEWLAERFRERREWSSDELKETASEAGVSKNALWSPEVLALPIRKRRRVNAEGEPHWVWIAEDGWPPAPNREFGNVGNLDA